MLSPNPQTAKWLSEEMLSLNPQRQCVHSMMTQQGDAESESTEKRSAVENPQKKGSVVESPLYKHTAVELSSRAYSIPQQCMYRRGLAHLMSCLVS